MQRFRIQVENSAPSQAKPAKSVSWASEILSNLGVKRVVDLGCGRLRNLSILQKYFSDITLVDTKLQCNRISGSVPNQRELQLVTISAFQKMRQKYDAIFLISVLHVIDQLNMRKQLISLAYTKLFDEGYFVVDVPSGEAYYRQQCTPEKRYCDGWVMGSGTVKTFYKNYTASELDGFITSNNSFVLFKKIYFDHHIIRIWKKMPDELFGHQVEIGNDK